VDVGVWRLAAAFEMNRVAFWGWLFSHLGSIGALTKPVVSVLPPAGLPGLGVNELPLN